MKGVIFTESNFLLTIQGVKKQTRRIIKPQPDVIRSINMVLGNAPDYELSEKPWTPEPAYHFLMHEGKYLKPRCEAGDVVYLKEPYILYHEIYQELMTTESGIQYAYKYGNNRSMEEITGNKHNKWENKLFMPERAARYFIKITGVRAERLQDISDADCIKEGINGCDYGGMQCVVYGLEKGLFFDELGSTPTKAYAALIDSINGKGTWDSNPFVWVYDYELTKQF